MDVIPRYHLFGVMTHFQMQTLHTIFPLPIVVHHLVFLNIQYTNSSFMRQSLNKEKKEKPLSKLQSGLTEKVIYLFVERSSEVLMFIP